MIPSISYPEAMAKVRVITLQDQKKHTVKTSRKADTSHTDTSKELISAGPINSVKEPNITHNTHAHVSAFLFTTLTLEQADTGDDINPVYTGPLREFVTYTSVAGEVNYTHDVTI